MPSILFGCTGTIFRSLTAAYAFKARLEPHSPLRVSSVGTVAIPQPMHPDVRAYLVQRGMDSSHHQQHQVSAELLYAADLVIAMSMDHQAFLFDTFRHYAALFNDICHGHSAPLWDVWEAVPTWETDLETARHYAFHVMEYIWASIPCLLQNLGTYLTIERADSLGSRVTSPAGPIPH